jgi:hypothetical protein
MVVREPVRGVDRAQRRGVERIPAPIDLGLVEVAGEAREVIERGCGIVASPGRATRDGIQAVRPRGPGNGAEPAIDNAVFGREVVVDR